MDWKNECVFKTMFSFVMNVQYYENGYLMLNYIKIQFLHDMNFLCLLYLAKWFNRRRPNNESPIGRHFFQTKLNKFKIERKIKWWKKHWFRNRIYIYKRSSNDQNIFLVCMCCVCVYCANSSVVNFTLILNVLLR